MPRKKPPSKVEQDLLEAMEQAVEFVTGKRKLLVRQVEVGRVAAARQRLGMTQDAFAAFLEVPLSTIRKWEQGARNPSGAARVLLTMIENEPNAVRRAIAAERKDRPQAGR